MLVELRRTTEPEPEATAVEEITAVAVPSGTAPGLAAAANARSPWPDARIATAIAASATTATGKPTWNPIRSCTGFDELEVFFGPSLSATSSAANAGGPDTVSYTHLTLPTILRV